MDTRPLPWLLAGAGLALGTGLLLPRGRKPQRLRRALREDRHIMILVGKEKNGTFVCGTEVLPKEAAVRRGASVIWHVANQCDQIVTIDLTDFENAQGENPFRHPPRPLTLLPQQFSHTSGVLRGDARQGRYTYKVFVNGAELDPELIMQ